MKQKNRIMKHAAIHSSKPRNNHELFDHGNIAVRRDP